MTSAFAILSSRDRNPTSSVRLQIYTWLAPYPRSTCVTLHNSLIRASQLTVCAVYCASPVPARGAARPAPWHWQTRNGSSSCRSPSSSCVPLHRFSHFVHCDRRATNAQGWRFGLTLAQRRSVSCYSPFPHLPSVLPSCPVLSTHTIP